MSESGASLAPARSGAAVSARRRQRRRARPVWALPYLLPAVALIGFVYGYPLLKVIEDSFQSAPGQPGSTFTTVNYSLAIEDPNFVAAIKHNLILLVAVPILVVLAALLAILLFRAGRASAFYRSAMFLPYVLAIPVVGVTFGIIYALNGPLNAGLGSVGLSSLEHAWLGTPSLALGAVMSVIVWKEFGFGLILFSARMSSIDEELYDAARVDGARWWAQHRHVTIPALGQVIQFFVVVEIITMFAYVFGYVYTLTRGGPGNASVVMEFQIWEQGFEAGAPGLAAATAVILLGAILAALVTLSVVRAGVRRAMR